MACTSYSSFCRMLGTVAVMVVQAVLQGMPIFWGREMTVDGFYAVTSWVQNRSNQPKTFRIIGFGLGQQPVDSGAISRLSVSFEQRPIKTNYSLNFKAAVIFFAGRKVCTAITFTFATPKKKGLAFDVSDLLVRFRSRL